MAHRQARTQECIDALTAVFGPRLSTAGADLRAHSHDESWHPPAAPDAVVYPESTEEVASALRICTAHLVPVIPFGIGSSLEGNVQAIEGGISVDTSRMRSVVAINAEDMDCIVEAVVDRESLASELRHTGLFFPVDPGAPATLGGMAATGAGGTTTPGYGSMRDNVLALEVVLASGEVVRTGTRARKTSSGYDLTRLFVGSEGTLGVITRLTLRLHPVPPAVAAMSIAIASLPRAVAFVQSVRQAGLPIARLELLDEVEMSAVNRYSHLGLPELPTLFIELHGTSAQLGEAVEELVGWAKEFDAVELRKAEQDEDRRRLWKARHDAGHAEKMLRPGAEAMVTDVCVPLSRLAECILAAKDDLSATGLTGALVGHVGDGNFHMSLLVDRSAPEEVAAAEAYHDRLVRQAIALGGTATGEHGIGLGKRRFLELEYGAEAVRAMRAVKAALDPLNLMNPGKVLPPDPADCR